MSTLTKVFTVLLVVFSIAFTVMTVSMVAQTTNWRVTAEKYQQHAQVADTNLRNLIAAGAAELVAANDAIKGHLSAIGKLEGQVRDKGAEVAQLQSELAKSASERSSSEAINRGLIAQLESSDKARAEYRQQRDELERRAIDIERRNIDLNDRVNEQTARIVVLHEQKRQFEQQIHILREENKKLALAARVPSSASAMEEPAAAAMSGVVAATPVSATAIRGKVVDVSGDIVTISVGASDGVQKEMVFVVHRDDQYIGDLKINLVDPDRSAGRPVGASFTPRPGDSVTDALRLGSSRG